MACQAYYRKEWKQMAKIVTAPPVGMDGKTITENLKIDKRALAIINKQN